MRVRVDEAGHERHVAEVDRARAGGEGRRIDTRYAAPFHHDARVGDDLPRRHIEHPGGADHHGGGRLRRGLLRLRQGGDGHHGDHGGQRLQNEAERRHGRGRGGRGRKGMRTTDSKL
jgi:hypothetical protein